MERRAARRRLTFDTDIHKAYTDLMWDDHLEHFEKVTRRVFRFLTEDRGFAGPVVQHVRDFSLIYTHPTDGRKISICLERGWLLPFISIETPTPTGLIHAHLPSTLRKLDISVDSTRFPCCHEVLPSCEAEAIASGFGILDSLTAREQYEDELSVEMAPFLEAHGGALQRDYDRIMEFAGTEEASDSVTLGGDTSWGDGKPLSPALFPFVLVLMWMLTESC